MITVVDLDGVVLAEAPVGSVEWQGIGLSLLGRAAIPVVARGRVDRLIFPTAGDPLKVTSYEVWPGDTIHITIRAVIESCSLTTA